MSSKCPVQLNPYDYARRNARVKGSISLLQFKRLAELIEPAQSLKEIELELQFEVDAMGKSWIKGHICGKVALICQRCLDNMEYGMSIRLHHLLCANEACLEQHKEMDTIYAEAETLVRLSDLLEDELLLELPVVARHEKDCLWHKEDKQQDADNKQITPAQKDNPFAVLKGKF